MQIVCPNCNATYRIADDRLPSRKTAARCKRCGGQIIIGPGPRPAAAAATHLDTRVAASRPRLPIDPQADLTAFIGPNADRYLSVFNKIEAKGGGRFVVTWHWPAALIGIWWLLYRKLYWWALVAFIASFIPLINIASIVIFGIMGNYIYYRHARKKIGALRGALPDDELSITLRQLGGVNRWVVSVGIVLGVIGAVGLLAAVIIPLVAEG